MKDGAGTGAWRLLRGKERGVEAMKTVLGEPWFREWQSAARRIAILTAQLDDEDLKKAVKALGVNHDHLLTIGKGDEQAFDAVRERLDDAYDHANERAGQPVPFRHTPYPARKARSLFVAE